MKNDLLQQTRLHTAGRVRLQGTVAGATACELVADGDEIVVGAATGCDLPVMDPLVPPQAFRLTRVKAHCGPGEVCRCHWMIEAASRARVYVNQRLAHRERLYDGDVVETGCHRFVFAAADAAPRNLRLHQNVADLCERLIAARPAPAGFIKDSPLYRYLVRRRRAVSVVGLAAAALLIVALLMPREETFEPIMPPLEVQVADMSLVTPSVRSLETVQRQAFDPSEPPPESPELAEKPVTPPPDQPVSPRIRDLPKTEAPKLTEKPPELKPVEQVPLLTETPSEPVERTVARLQPAATEQRRSVLQATVAAEPAQLAAYEPARKPLDTVRAIKSEVAAGRPEAPKVTDNPQTWQLPILPPAPVETAGAAVQRTSANLSGPSLPVRRLSVAESIQMAALAGDAAALRANAVSQPASGPVTRAAVRDVLASLEKPKTDGLNADPSKTYDKLAAYKASPVSFESFQGMRVPVVRISEQMEELVSSASTDAIKIDGTVSDQEIAVSWKSGQFHTHAPGQPPPKADPPTYCYVGKTELGGKPFLYIGFVCVDPDVGKLVVGSKRGEASDLIRDDSVEIFLDVNNDKKDYFQLIANAKGDWWSAYYPKPMIEGTIQNRPQTWDAGATVKTSVTREPGQWVCELLIPFDRIGGVPAKGTRWGVNFARNFRGQIEDWQLQSWFAVYDKARNYHHPSLFGIFQW